MDDTRVAVRAKEKTRVPNVLAPDEVAQVIEALRGDVQLVTRLLYGSGLRLNEALELRIKDVDLRRGVLIVRSGKGAKDRRTVLPESVMDDLRRRILDSRTLHQRDVARGGGSAYRTRSPASCRVRCATGGGRGSFLRLGSIATGRPAA